ALVSPRVSGAQPRIRLAVRCRPGARRSVPDNPRLTTHPFIRSAMAATTSELYQDLDLELAATRRVLERVPFEHWTWRPHEESMPLGRLATHLAELPRFAEMIATTDELDMAASPNAPTKIENREQLLTVFDTHAAKMRGVVASMDDAKLKKHWRLRMGD